MKIKKKKQDGSSLRLTDKKHPIMGIASLFLGLTSVITFIALCFVSGRNNGEAGLMVGLAGIMCFVVSLCGFMLSWLSLKQENIRLLFPTVAAVINGLSSVFYFLLYLWGNLM